MTVVAGQVDHARQRLRPANLGAIYGTVVAPGRHYSRLFAALYGPHPGRMKGVDGLRSVFRLGAVALLASATPVIAQDSHSLLAPDRYEQIGDDVAAIMTSRATSAIDRPPAPLPHVHTEGTLPGQGIREASAKARQDLQIALDFAVAWRTSHDRRYLAQFTRYLSAWLATYRISLNPIDETWFDRLILATDLVKPDLDPAQRRAVDAFWRQMAEGYLDAMQAPRSHLHTNWQSHRVKLATLAAYQLGDAALIARARAAFRDQVTANIRPDGSVFDFYERDALHYVVYDLDPLLMAAIAAQRHGEDWYKWRSPTGSSLAGAVSWLMPYADGTLKHMEFVHSKIAFDLERAAAGQKQFAPHEWNPAGAVDTFALAALCDPSLRLFASSLSKRTETPVQDWLRLL